MQEKPPAAASTWDDPDWSELLPKLDLRGVDRLLASNCALLGRDGDKLRLALDGSAETYRTRSREKALQDALSRHFGESLTIEFVPAEGKAAAAAETPMQKQAREQDEDLQAKRAGLEADPNIVALKDMFGATLDPDSVRVSTDD